MCITEEEFRCERKRAMEVLEELKKLEASFEMVTVKIDAKTVKSSKKTAISNAHKPRRKPNIMAAGTEFFDFSLREFFEGFDCGEGNIF